MSLKSILLSFFVPCENGIIALKKNNYSPLEYRLYLLMRGEGKLREIREIK